MDAVLIENYENLAVAIIEQALVDYEKALVKLRKVKSKLMSKKLSESEEKKLNLQKILAEAEIESIKRFSKSAWFSTLTSLDGDVLLKGVERNVTG